MRTAIWAPGLLALTLVLAGCTKNPLLVERSLCTAVAIPHHVGSHTRFDPPQSRDADAISFTAQITDLRGDCIEAPDYLITDVRYRVTAQRREAGAAEQVRVPIFLALVQGGNVLVSKQISGVTLDFPAGRLRTEAAGYGRAEVHRSAATLSPELQQRISRQRRPDEADALVDPMSDPQVRAAVRAATFEILVGFQLEDADLAYNIAR